MPIQRTSKCMLHVTDQWQSLQGNVVEVRLQGNLYCSGLVDAAMADGSGLWLAANGAMPREFIEKTSGNHVYTRLYPRSSH
jgi:hypothetical protein